MSPAAELKLIALPDFPPVASGDDIAAMTAEALARAGLVLRTGDVFRFPNPWRASRSSALRRS
jgi:hypothetical protein